MATSDETIREAAEDILMAHQRHTASHCLCGWSELGRSHPGHQVQMLREAGLLRQEMNAAKIAARLEAAWDDGNAMGLDGWVGPERGTEPDEYAIQHRRRIVDRLVDEVSDGDV